MADNAASMHALFHAYRQAVAPVSGSTLSFLLAAPGEAEFLFARAGAAEPEQVRINLGSATWFNEPVLRTLASLAPAVEALLDDARTQGYSLRIEDSEKEPPLQVLCLTDGMDNSSPTEMRDLG